MVMVIVTSTSISARRSRPRGSWQGDSDILISFEGCNLFREKSFLSGGTYVVKKSQATLNVTSLSR